MHVAECYILMTYKMHRIDNHNTPRQLIVLSILTGTDSEGSEWKYLSSKPYFVHVHLRLRNGRIPHVL